MMSTKYRFFWSRLSRMTTNLKSFPIKTTPKITINNVTPCMLGFSLFTWLGFQKKPSAEDELILTIKHCILFIQRTDYDKAEQLLHVALRQAQQIRHQLGITYIYDVMANLALEREQLDKAKKLFVNVAQRVMADGAKEDDARVVHISAKLARISHLQKEYTTAQLGYDWCLEKLKNAITKEPSEEIIKILAITEDWYGRLFLECNQCEQGLKLMVSSLNRMKEVSDVEKEHIVLQLNDIGTVCDRLDRTDESIDYFQQAINMGKSLEMRDLGVMYVNLGRVYIKKKLIHEARKNCGYGWKLSVMSKNNDIKHEAELCIKEINSIT